MISFKYVYTVLKLIKRQSISKFVYFMMAIGMPVVITMVFFLYFSLAWSVHSYTQILKNSFFGFQPPISIEFNRINNKFVPFFVHKLQEYGISYTKVYKYFAKGNDKNIFLLQSDKQNVLGEVNILAYEDKFFEDKFLSEKNMVITKTLYEKLQQKKVFFLKSSNGTTATLDNLQVIDVGFVNANPILIMKQSYYQMLGLPLVSNQIDINSDEIDKINEIYFQLQRRNPRLEGNLPKLIKNHKKNEYKEINTIFDSLKKIKNILTTVLLVLILLTILACINMLKELKEKQFQILKNLGIVTSEIVIAFLIVEFFFVFLCFSAGIGLFMWNENISRLSEALSVLYGQNILLLYVLGLVLSGNIFYIWRLFQYDKFD